jgi:hypothetical protein
MTHRLHQAIAAQLERHLKDHRVVVWYDTRSEFAGFIDELEIKANAGGLPSVRIGGTTASLIQGARSGKTSLVAIKLTVEPLVSLDLPDPVVIYLPGMEPDRQNSPIMELELAGIRWELQLRREVRRILSDSHSDAAIDKLLAPEAMTYADLIAYCVQDDSGARKKLSPLRSIFADKGLTSEHLLARWIAQDDHDGAIDAKQAQGELYDLLASRIGLALEPNLPLAKARHHARRYVLVNEFRDDYRGEVPAMLGSIPKPTLKEHRERIGDITRCIREVDPGDPQRRLGQHYTAIADAVQAEIQLEQVRLDPAKLGIIDTFRCEEALLLGYAANLVLHGEADAAITVVRDRGVSFWTMRNTARAAQWELCRRLAVLRQIISSVERDLPRAGSQPAAWIDSYAADAGWHRVDQAHRSMESWVSSLSDDPTEGLTKALATVRAAYDGLMDRMAQGFSQSLKDAQWSVRGPLHQTRIFPEVVEGVPEPTAYILVDAMRFEMADDLRKLLVDAQELHLRPAVAALPTITPVGMAALQPGASTSFTIIPTKAGLGARVDGNDLANLRDRQRYLKAVRPKSVDISLDDVLTKAPSEVKKRIKDATLVVVRTTDIDELGESGGLIARQVMEQVVSNLARSIRKLAKLGIARFVVTADHGHQFATERDEGSKIPAPGGETIDLHRRCWIGRGGQVTDAAWRVTSGELGYAGDLDLAFPKGCAVFAAGGDLAYHHGGISLQELVIPVLSGRMPTATAATESGRPDLTFHETPTTITNRIFRVQISLAKQVFELAATAVRLVAIDKALGEVGRAGMATNAKRFDAATGVIELEPGAVVDVALMLTNDKATAIRIAVLDVHTDAELGTTGDIPVKLGL